MTAPWPGSDREHTTLASTGGSPTLSLTLTAPIEEMRQQRLYRAALTRELAVGWWYLWSISRTSMTHD